MFVGCVISSIPFHLNEENAGKIINWSSNSRHIEASHMLTHRLVQLVSKSVNWVDNWRCVRQGFLTAYGSELIYLRLYKEIG